MSPKKLLFKEKEKDFKDKNFNNLIRGIEMAKTIGEEWKIKFFLLYLSTLFFIISYISINTGKIIPFISITLGTIILLPYFNKDIFKKIFGKK